MLLVTFAAKPGSIYTAKETTNGNERRHWYLYEGSYEVTNIHKQSNVSKKIEMGAYFDWASTKWGGGLGRGERNFV